MLIAVALLAGCGEDGPPPDPHELVACDPAWGGAYAVCEAACVPPEREGGGTCRATLTVPGIGTGEVACIDYLTTFDGVRGCCMPGTDEADGTRGVRFAVCIN